MSSSLDPLPRLPQLDTSQLEFLADGLSVDVETVCDLHERLASGVEPDCLVDLRHKQTAKADLDSGTFQMGRDAGAVDAELLGELVHAGTCLVLSYKVSRLGWGKPAL